MLDQMIADDQLIRYQVKEIPVVIVAALAYILAVGSITLASIIVCGWRGSESLSIDWIRGKAIFVCRR